MLITTIAITSGSTVTAQPAPSGIIIVRLADTTTVIAAERSLYGLGCRTIDRVNLPGVTFLAVRPDVWVDTNGLAERIIGLPMVAYLDYDLLLPSRKPDNTLVESSTLTGASKFPDDPLFAQQWWLRNDGSRPGSVAGADISIAGAWEVTKGDSLTVIAIGEEGYETEHPDLAGAFVADSAQAAEMNRPNAHGTQVIGVIAARHGNGIGIAGIAPDCHILVTHAQYGLSTLAILKTLEKVVEWNAAVFTNSWGFRQTVPRPLQEAYDLVARTGRDGRGVLIIFGTGNDGEPWVYYPSWWKGFLAVGASDDRDSRWISSNYGRALDMIAPGADITTTSLGATWTRTSGTSIAAPMVAGVAALVASVNPNLTADSIRAILERSCDRVGGYDYSDEREHGAWSPYTGYGRLNATRALRLAQGLPPDTARLVWPLGGERLAIGRSHPVRWESDRRVTVVVRGSSGSLDTLARDAPPGYGIAEWVPNYYDIATILLLSPDTGATLYATQQPITISGPLYSVAIDSTTPFVSLLDSGIASVAKYVKAIDGNDIVVPFDVVIDRDVTWSWSADALGLRATRLPDEAIRAASIPTMLDARRQAAPAIVPLLSNLITRADSIRIALFGNTPNREFVVEATAITLDSQVVNLAGRQEYHDLAWQIRLRERDGSISVALNRPFDITPYIVPESQSTGIITALRTRSDLVLPFGNLFVDRIPAGSIIYRRTDYQRVITPGRTLVSGSTEPITYGYDIYNGRVITNIDSTVGVRVSTDKGISWQDVATFDPPEQQITFAIPPAYQGEILVALKGVHDNGWRDTLVVVDHGYTIDTIETRNELSIADDPRAAAVEFASGESESEIPLSFIFPFFDTDYRRIAVGRNGTIQPINADGSNTRFNNIGVFPRYLNDNPDSNTDVQLLLVREGEFDVAIIEWSNLLSYSPDRRASAQVRLRSDGRIDFHLFDATGADVPYYSAPSISTSGFFLRHPDFRIGHDPQGPVALPIASYRFTLKRRALGVVAPQNPARYAPAIIEVTPLPSHDRVVLSCTGKHSRAWSATIRTLHGRVVASLEGNGDLEWNATGMPAGLYFVEENNGTARGRIIIVR